jgi:hypothetical protein
MLSEHLIENYLHETTSSVATRGVLLGWQRRRQNSGATLLTQVEYRGVVHALRMRWPANPLLQQAGAL